MDRTRQVSNRARWTATALIVLLGCERAGAAGSLDPASLYELASTESTARLKAGERGKLVVLIKPVVGAHVTAPPESPLRITASAPHLVLDAPELKYVNPKDQGKSIGQEATAVDTPRFELPFTATQAGRAMAEVQVTFLICKDKTLCARQKRSLSVPVEVL